MTFDPSDVEGMTTRRGPFRQLFRMKTAVLSGFIVLLAAWLFLGETRGRLAGIGLSFLLGGGLIASQARTSRTIEAEKFVLRDEDGRLRALLGMTPYSPRFSLFYDLAKIT